jgi:hypothetical protein
MKEGEICRMREQAAEWKEIIDRERIISKDAQTLKITLEEEMARRKTKERECEQIRIELQQLILIKN